MAENSAPAGWYPADGGRQRWWDGQNWGPYAEEWAPAPEPEPVAPEPVVPEPVAPEPVVTAPEPVAPEPEPVSAASAPPGWYDDGSGQQRWWDGSEWAAPAAPVQPEPAPAAQYAPAAEYASAAPYAPAAQYAPAGHAPRKRPVWPWIVGAAGLVVILVAAGLIWFFVARGGAGAAGAPGDAVLAFDHATQTLDCAEFQAVTTTEYRESSGTETCEDFESVVLGWDLGRDYEVTVVTTSVLDDTAEVGTSETETGDDGEPLTAEYNYQLVLEDDVWKVDSLEFVE